MTQDREELKRLKRDLLSVRYVREGRDERDYACDLDCDAEDYGARQVNCNPDGPKAAQAIASLLSDLEAMQEALKPFKRYYDLNDLQDRPDDDVIEVPVGDVRRARQALSKEPEA